MKIIPVLFASLLLFSGCSLSSHYLQSGASTAAPEDPARVRVYAGQPGGKHIVLGAITVDVLGDADSALETMKEKAAELGANAVIQTRLTAMNTYVQRRAMNGIAVRMVSE